MEESEDVRAVEVAPPWQQIDWSEKKQRGGAGRSAFPGRETTTMRIPKIHRDEIKRIAIWVNEES